MEKNIALIKNNLVENIIVSTLDFANTLGYEQVVDVTDKNCSIGDSYINNEFIPAKKEIIAEEIVKVSKEQLLAELQALTQKISLLE